MGSLWGNRAFRWVVIGRSINLFGNSIAPIALAFAIIDLTDSPTDLGLVVGARSLANVLFLLVGGVVADRIPKHVVLVGSMLVACLSQLALTILVAAHHAEIATLMVLAAVNGIATAFAMPASAALLGQVLTGQDRQRGNAVNSFMRNGAMILGASAGGLLVAAFGPVVGLAIDAATFALAALVFSLVRVATSSTTDRQSPLSELREGWRELVTHTWIWVVVLGFCVLNACFNGIVMVLGPVVADDTIGRRAWGFVLAAESVGLIVGAIIALRLKLKRPLLVGVLCMFAEIPLFVLLAERPDAIALMTAAFVAGIGIEQFGIAWETSMQTHVEPDKLARVYSWDMLGSFLAIPIGTVAAGPAAEQLGLENAILGAAALMAVAILAMALTPSVRKLSDHHGRVLRSDELGPETVAA